MHKSRSVDDTAIEFGSRDWLDAARKELQRLLCAVDFGETTFRLLERYTDAPAYLAGDDGEVAISIECSGSDCSMSDQVVDAPDFWVIADYEASLPTICTVYTDEPEQAKRLESYRLELEAKGLRSSGGGFENCPPALLTVLLELHNYMAMRTKNASAAAL